jgi:hypothetical protein
MNPYIRLAEAIERGHTMIGEDRLNFLTPPSTQAPCGCALGAAWVGSGMTVGEFWDGRIKTDLCAADYIADRLGISGSLARAINSKHCLGIPRLEIAKWLRTLPEAQEPAAPQVARLETPESSGTGANPDGRSHEPATAAAHKWADEKVKSLFRVAA